MLVCLSPFSGAATIGWIVVDGYGGDPTAAISAAGHTPTSLTGLSAGDLDGLSILWIFNGDRDAYGAEVTDNVAAIADFVRQGGVLSFHDQYVAGAAGVLPGAELVAFFEEDFENDADIDVLVNNLVTNGPGGIVDNSTLDGGISSSHGYASLASLPAGAVAVLSRSDPNEIVDFYYRFGLGFVYYSTIPLDFYFEAGDPGGEVGANFRDIYAVNEAAFQASLSGDVGPEIPEPATVGLLGLGLLSLALIRRRALS